MAIVTTDNKHYKNIANKIREKIVETENVFPNEMADKVEEVYQRGMTDGAKSEYDRFWDNIQENGKQMNYRYTFTNWNDRLFYPKYNLNMGTYSEGTFWGNRVLDLVERLKECGVTLDTTSVMDFGSMFAATYTKHIPVISTISATRLGNVFQNSNAVTIDKIIFKTDGSQAISNTFITGCAYLENIIIEGVIGANFNIHESPKLTKESITSIVDALSVTTVNLTLKLSLTAVNNAFETSTGLADGSTSQEWLDLVATKPNWTISLA